MIELQRKKRRLSKQAVESCFPRSRRHDNLLLISERKHDIASQDGDRNNEYWIRLFILVMNQGWKSHSPILYLSLWGFAKLSGDFGAPGVLLHKTQGVFSCTKHFLLQLKPCFISIDDWWFSKKKRAIAHTSGLTSRTGAECFNSIDDWWFSKKKKGNCTYLWSYL